MPCLHLEFEAHAAVYRLVDDDDDDHADEVPATAYSVDVKVRCASCGMPFRFVGVGSGASPWEPKTSVGGDELRAPIEPAPECPRWEQAGVAGHA